MSRVDGRLLEPSCFLSRQNRCAMPDQCFCERRDGPGIHNQVVFGATDQPVIERLACHDGTSRAIKLAGERFRPGHSGPTPIAGVRELYAVFTSPAPPWQAPGTRRVARRLAGCSPAPERSRPLNPIHRC